MPLIEEPLIEEPIGMPTGAPPGDRDRLVRFMKVSAALTRMVASMWQTKIEPPANLRQELELYGKMIWVYKATQAMATACAAVDIQLVNTLNEDEIVTDHPALDLLKKPSPQTSGYELWEATFIYLELAGMSFWEIARPPEADNTRQPSNDGTPGMPEPAELYTMRPDRIEIIPDPGGKGIKEYNFKTESETGEGETFTPQQCVYLRYFNPVHDWHGQGTIKAASDAVTLERRALQWTDNFFEHGGMPPGILTAKEPTGWTDDEIDHMIERLEEKIKHRQTPFIEGLDYVKLGATMQDMDFEKLRRFDREEILAGPGTPPVRVGLLEHASYANAAIQTRLMYLYEVVPRLRRVGGALNTQYLPLFDDVEGLEIRFDYAPFIKEDENEKATRIEKIFGMGALSPNDVATEFGREVSAEDKANPALSARYISTKFTPIDEAALTGGAGEEALEGALGGAVDEEENDDTEEDDGTGDTDGEREGAAEDDASEEED